jgi:hypothetical protein
MPVYEIVMQHPGGRRRVRYGERVPAEIGDALTIDSLSRLRWSPKGADLATQIGPGCPITIIEIASYRWGRPASGQTSIEATRPRSLSVRQRQRKR